MNFDSCTYTIRLHGQVGEGEINANSPIHMAVTQAGLAGTLLTVNTDQSGLVGLLGYLHGRGLVLLAIERANKTGGA